MANSIDPDQMPHSVASDLSLHYLLRPACLNAEGEYGMQRMTAYTGLPICRL